ncbi:MAG: hypothetical protein ACRC5A_09515 [Enterobacteriaceae bacterium]
MSVIHRLLLKPISRLAAWLILFSLSSLALAATPQVLSGHIGKMPVVVELDLSQPDNIAGRYFYRKYLMDIPLSGKLSGNTLTLHEILYDPDTQEKVPGLTLHKQQAGWTGEWHSASADKKLTISLNPLQVKAPEPDADSYWQTLYRTRLYDYVRMNALPLQKGKTEQFMGHQLQWWIQPNSKISLFELQSGYDKPTLSRLNTLLRARLWSAVSDYYDCLLSASRHGGSYSQTVTPGLMTPSILSVNILTHYDCAGAHPDFSNDPLNIDVQRGQPLLLEDVLWVGEGQPFRFDPLDDTPQNAGKNSVDFSNYNHYRTTRFAPWLVGELSRLQPTKMKKPPQGEGCDYTDPDVWTLASWYFTPKGILFDPYFVRVLRSCQGPTWSVIPYPIIRQHPGRIKISLPD